MKAQILINCKFNGIFVKSSPSGVPSQRVSVIGFPYELR